MICMLTKAKFFKKDAMKVLLLQEMSGVHTELKKGLAKLGVQAELATYGQHFRKYQSDISMGKEGKEKFISIQRATTQLLNIPKFKTFDVIQMISPNPFHKGIANIMEKSLFVKDKKLVYVAAGSDQIYLKHVQELEYWPPHKKFETEASYNSLVDKLSNFTVIPVCWEYQYSMQAAGVISQNIIPFPIDVDVQKFRPFKRGKKIVVFHPINRNKWKEDIHDFKGTSLIIKAFDKLIKKYSDKVEFIAKGDMTAREYDEFTNHVDVIVDQAYSYSYGMSAAYGLAKGKIVLSGLEEVVRSGHYAEAPVINIKPDVDDIANKIEELIEDQLRMEELCQLSRLFAEKYHDSTYVAGEFMKYYL